MRSIQPIHRYLSFPRVLHLINIRAAMQFEVNHLPDHFHMNSIKPTLRKQYTNNMQSSR